MGKLAPHPSPVTREGTSEAPGSSRRTLIAETFERIAALWVDGAAQPPPELEHAIDAAARAGDGAALTAALAAYEAAAWASCVAAGDSAA